MRLSVFSRLRRDRTPLGAGKFRLQRIGNFRSDVAFNGKDVGQLAIIPFRPKMRVAVGINQLNVYSHLITRFLNSAFQDIGDAELFRDLRKVVRGTFEALRRSARDDLKVANPRESGQDFLLNAVSEIGVRLVIAEIFKWQNRN